MSTREKVIALLDSLGVPHAPREAWASWGYDGKTVATGSRASVEVGKGRSLSTIVHDGAHWLVAPEERRAVPDFGLGSGPDSRKASPTTTDVGLAIHEESSASLLGILWEVVLGMNFEDTLWDHAWLDDESPRDSVKLNAELLCLRRRGFLRDPRLVEAKAVEKVRNAVKKARAL